MLLLRILPVFTILLFGYAAGHLRIFPSVRDAIGVLNRYSLYIAAPLLIFWGMIDPRVEMPNDPGFYLAHVLALAVAMGVVWMFRWSPRLRPHVGSLALCTAYGNITFLGIPVLQRAFGDEALGLAALSSGVHTILAMSVGPALFLLWNASDGEEHLSLSDVGKRLVRQPMVWAPLVGLLARFASVPAREVMSDYASTLGVTAGPVAIFMLGLYVWESRAALKRVKLPAVVAVTLKLLVFPAVTFGVVIALVHVFPLTRLQMLIIVSQAAMPTAITTYSLAEEFANDRETVASAAVLSALVSLVTLPLVMDAAERVFMGV